METLRETNAVVTGASSGIGREIACAFAEAGATRLLVHYRNNAAGADETVQRLKQLGCDASACAADLAIAEDRERLIQRAFKTLGTIHTWVNNAGADVLTGSQAEQTFEEKLDRLWQVDVQGTILLSRTIAERLSRQSTPQPSSLIFIGWDQAPRGMEGDAGMMFGPIKAAVMAFASSLAQTLAPRVRVNTIAPGWIKTSWGADTSAYWDLRAKRQSLMDRWGSPRDVAKAAVYLADPDNSFLTGQTVEVNGGWNRTFPDSQR